VSSSAPPPVVAVGGIAVADQTLLLVQRAQPPQAGRWTIPGGRLEAGESVTEAVEREVLEETGLIVRCGAFVGWVERRGPDHHFVILDFAVTPSRPASPVAGGDAASVAWVPFSQVPTWPLVDGLAQFLVDHGVLP
jgi:8-oxo-dGTP diphosphatase